MSLIALIIALILERTRHYQSRWLWQDVTHRWFSWLPCKYSFSWLVLGVGLPTIFVAIIQWFIRGWFLGIASFILWIAIPLLTLGCPQLQKSFREYLRDSIHDPQEACHFFNQQLDVIYPGCASQPLDSLEQTSRFLCWINFRYYFSVIFWFSLGGPFLAIAYGLLRSLHRWAIQNSQSECSVETLTRLLHWIDWVPARLSAFSFVVCAGSANGFKVWLHSLRDVRRANADWLGQVGAECRERHEGKPNTYNQMMMATVCLLKSSILLTLVIIALFTLYGWLV